MSKAADKACSGTKHEGCSGTEHDFQKICIKYQYRPLNGYTVMRSAEVPYSIN